MAATRLLATRAIADAAQNGMPNDLKLDAAASARRQSALGHVVGDVLGHGSESGWVRNHGNSKWRSSDRDQPCVAFLAQASAAPAIGTASPTSYTGFTRTSFQKTYLFTNEATTLGSSASTST